MNRCPRSHTYRWVKVDGGVRRGRRKGKAGNCTKKINQLIIEIKALCRDDGVPDVDETDVQGVCMHYACV